MNTTKSVDDTEAERHRAKMAKRKAVQDAEVAEKTHEKGLLIVHTGAGKGKSTAAFGLALRMLGRDHRVGVVQFIKGAWHSAERDALEKFGEQVSWHTMGEGFTWETQDLQRDIAAAERAWAKAQELMADPSFGLIILDELNVALRYDYLPIAEVVETLGLAAARLDAEMPTLSGGQAARVGLAAVLLSRFDVLLLDEPTNDLDVDTLRALEDALLSFAGCAVVISHDRWFLDRIATHMLAFEGDSHVEWFEGNYQDYEADRKKRLGALPLGGALLGHLQPRQQRRIEQVGCHVAQPA